MSDDAQKPADWLKLEVENVRLPNGRETLLSIVRHPGAAAIVPLLDDERVLLIRQYRFAAGGDIWEVPAGKLDPGEAPEACAARELQEETGYRAGRLQPLAPYLASPGFTDELIHLFAAFDLQDAEQQLEEDEVIELHPTPFERALEMVWSGEIYDGKSATALLHAAHHLGRL